jgi:hypothetical protein
MSSLVQLMRAASAEVGAYVLETRMVGRRLGAARTGRDEASRRDGRARTRRDSIPHEMCKFRQGMAGETTISCKDDKL